MGQTIKRQLIASGIALLMLSASATGQQKEGGLIPVPPSTSKGSSGATKPKVDYAEFVLSDGRPAYRYIVKDGKVAEIQYTEANGEAGFVIPVYHVEMFNRQGCKGFLYVTRNRIAYDGNTSDDFNYTLSELKKAKSGGSFGVEVNTPKKDYDFTLRSADDYDFAKFHKPVAQLFDRMITDFDGVVREFRQSTATAKEIRPPVLAPITSSYDRFKDSTTVSVNITLVKPPEDKNPQLGPTFLMGVGYEFRGQVQREAPERFFLYFEYYVFEGRRLERDVFSYAPELIILADGQRIGGRMQRTEYRDAINGKHEVVTLPVDYETLKRIAEAQKVEMRVGTVELELKDSHRQSLREFLARARP